MKNHLTLVLGAFFGALTLGAVFYFILTDQYHPLVPPFLALGIALASGFIGGDAAASGEVSWPAFLRWAPRKPILFALTGGVAVFLIVLLFLSVLLPCPPFKRHDDAIEVSIPQGWTLGKAIRTVESAVDVTVVTKNCPANFRDLPIDRGVIREDSTEKLIKSLQYRLRDDSITYDVNVIRKGMRYEIACAQLNS